MATITSPDGHDILDESPSQVEGETDLSEPLHKVNEIVYNEDFRALVQLFEATPDQSEEAWDLVKEDFDETIGFHPCIAEEITTLKVTKSSGEDPGKTGC